MRKARKGIAVVLVLALILGAVPVLSASKVYAAWGLKVGVTTIPVDFQAGNILYLKMSDGIVNALLLNAKEKDVIRIQTSVVSTFAGISFDIDPAWFDKAKNLDFTVHIPNGGVHFTRGTMDELRAQFTGKIRVDITGDPYRISMKQNGKEISWYSYKNPLILWIPPIEDGFYEYGDCVALKGEGEDAAPVPRSWGGNKGLYFTTKAYETGTYTFNNEVFPSFPDTKGKWMDEAVRYMAKRGVIKGAEGQFLPDKPVTRADYVTMLIRIFQFRLPAGAEGAAPYTDISENAYYFEAVSIAKALNLIAGDSTAQFCPTDPVTRQDMLVMTERAMKEAGIIPGEMTEEMVAFDDWDSVAEEARESVQNLAKLSIVTGSDGKVNPAGSTSRAEAAQILYKMLKYDQNI